jgi:hypothetical protein
MRIVERMIHAHLYQRVRQLLQRLSITLRDRWKAIVAIRAELLTAAAFLAGWVLITWAIALYTSPRIWLVSGGLLLISLGGWEFLLTIMRKGLYSLTRPEEKNG